MNFIYTFLISFIIVFVSELGDKTQLLVLSFSNKDKTYKILLGVAIGSFFSHGIAILFGSHIGLLENATLHTILEWVTYISFILMGIFSLLPKKETLSMQSNGKDSLIDKITNFKINYCLLIALSIIIGELGDKTFLASLGLGVQYPNAKVSLVLGAILGMVVCDSIAIVFGKFLNKHISEKVMQKVSGVLFLLFGFIGIFSVSFQAFC